MSSSDSKKQTESEPPKPVDMVAQLMNCGRARDFSIKLPPPQKGMLMVNTADGKVYRGSADGKKWEVHTTPNPNRTILYKNPAVLKEEMEAKKKALQAKKEALEDAEAADDIEKKTRLRIQRELARREEEAAKSALPKPGTVKA